MALDIRLSVAKGFGRVRGWIEPLPSAETPLSCTDSEAVTVNFPPSPSPKVEAETCSPFWTINCPEEYVAKYKKLTT